MSKKASSLFRQYPVLTITGPRQSGKTTLAQTLFPKLPYVNLEYPDIRRFAIEDPRGFLNQYPHGAVLDEIQRTPEIPSYIQGIVDSSGKNGMFVLTGSQQFEISQNISQSLAGRTALVRLLPFELKEIPERKDSADLNQFLFNGSYPAVYVKNIQPPDFYANYVETYLERDLRHLSQIDNLILFEKCIRLLAGRTGQLLNFNSLANDLGVSQPTVNKWVSLLQASYIIFLLPPFYRNIGKRLIKTPKVYFYDTGLLCYLLGIEAKAQLTSHPLRGSLFENMVILEILKKRFNRGKRSNLYFFRDRTGNEIDVVMDDSTNLLPIEIKSAQTASVDFKKGIEYFTRLFPGDSNSGYVIYAGGESRKIKKIAYVPWNDLPDNLGQ